jgi:hypothetical protein
MDAIIETPRLILRHFVPEDLEPLAELMTNPNFMRFSSGVLTREQTANFLFDRVIGSIFIAAATAIATGRVVAGVHYPTDILAGALIGSAAALLIVRLAHPLIGRIVSTLERAIDPLLAPIWRRADHH